LQAFGAPVSGERSGRGTRKLWSYRVSTTMKFRGRMWHEVQRALGEPSSWKWCAFRSNVSAWWQRVQRRLSGNRTFPECASWQSPHVTPRRCIFDWRNDPTSYTSSRNCPSAW
jgi:hypothetical protein